MFYCPRRSFHPRIDFRAKPQFSDVMSVDRKNESAKPVVAGLIAEMSPSSRRNHAGAADEAKSSGGKRPLSPGSEMSNLDSKVRPGGPHGQAPGRSSVQSLGPSGTDRAHDAGGSSVSQDDLVFRCRLRRISEWTRPRPLRTIGCRGKDRRGRGTSQ